MALPSAARVVIVGAGPAGTAAAAHLGQLGVDGVVLVDRHDFPRDKTCGSGLSPKAIATLRDLGVWRRIEPDAYPIRGLRLVTPGGFETRLAASGVEAAVCLRRHFDHHLLRAATERGATFVPNVTVGALLEEGGRAVGVVGRGGETLRADHVVIAGGAHCRLAGAPPPERRLIHAILGYFEGVPFTPHVLEMVYDERTRPYYGWLFPESETRVNIGITYPSGGEKISARARLEAFLDTHYRDRLRRARPIGDLRGHPIAYRSTIGPLTRPGLFVVGEAGQLTHPATAEGIFQGLRSGMGAAEAIADVVHRRADEATARAAYERDVRRTFQASFWAGELFRGFADSAAFDAVARLGRSPSARALSARLLAAM